MNSQGRRRVPRIEGVRDVITAMDFVLASIAKPRERAPAFVKFRDEIVDLVTECEVAIAGVGKAEDIERLHTEAVEHEERAARGLAEAQDQAEKATSDARKEAKRITAVALTREAAKKSAQDERDTAQNERDEAFKTESEAEQKRQTEMKTTLDGRDEKLIEGEKALAAKVGTMDAREDRLKEGQEAVQAQRKRFKTALEDG